MTLGTLEWRAERQMRKSLVLPIMYGWYRDASEADMAAWRQMAADFINGKRDDVPLTLADFKALDAAEGCPCRGDCILEHSSHPDEMALCPDFKARTSGT